MFLTANSLATQYGIDDTIAKFYVDREPPKNNLYWKDKLLYLRPQPGYIFLPLITDLFYRSGISKNELLSEQFVQALEQIGHYAAQQEFGLISSEQAYEYSMKFISTKGDEEFAITLNKYFRGEPNSLSSLKTPFKALHRGDLFLYSLAILKLDTEKRTELIITWFALISSLLLLDDAEDFEADRAANDENAFIESGANLEGFQKIKQLLASNLDHLGGINKTLANALHKKFTAIAEKPFIKEYLNA